MQNQKNSNGPANLTTSTTFDEDISELHNACRVGQKQARRAKEKARRKMKKKERERKLRIADTSSLQQVDCNAHC